MRYEDVVIELAPLSDYERGLAEGLRSQAWQREGVEYVGVMGLPLVNAVAQAIVGHRGELAAAGPSIGVSVLVATCGEDSWARLAQDRAYASTRRLHGDDFESHVAHYPEETVAGARNRVAKLARKDWLCFLDADDELERDYLQAMAAANAGWVFPEPLPPWNPGAPPLLVPAVRYVRDDAPGEAAIPQLGRWPELNECVVGTLVHRRLFEWVGGFREATDDGTPLSSLEDYDLWLRCFDAGARLLHVPAAVYRAHVSAAGRNRDQSPYDAVWRDHIARAQTVRP